MGLPCLSDIFNFAAGPAIMPATVLAQAQQELLRWNGSGLSILETPFTGEAFKWLLQQAREDLKTLLNIPDNYHILFMHGGASAQFSLVPLNLLGIIGRADYVETGYWSRKSICEAKRYCDINIAASSAATNFDRMPETWRIDPRAAYCHITSNETANGVQFHDIQDTADVPLVADMTSDFLSRPIDVQRYGLIYAGAQKNIGPAGLTIVIIRDDLLGRAQAATPLVFNYQAQVAANSMLNTPITFGVYLAGLVFKWIAEMGGVMAMARNSEQRSARLYQAIDASGGFYHCPVQPAHRSCMNVCFTLASETLTHLFLNAAATEGLVNLKGHPMTGGVRASLYNAMPDAGVTALINFMQHFLETHHSHV
ncbi:phosphoserine aminotransferase [mine drainage metagenome]|uniref:phosphoserine transaminase n=1 Tax=mine drainage metagenome TaxID=410659 RepID=A0A1J5RSC8_9ZZZZ